MANPALYDSYIDALRRWFWVEDEEGIRIIIAAVIAGMMPGEPIWLFIIDPPGALKTEICRSLNGPRIYPVDSLTPQSLISGFRAKKGTKIDILPELDGKILVVKDFTTILNLPEATRGELFGRLRAAYDGYLEQAYGSGVMKKSFRAKFGIIAAVTPVIEVYHKVYALLGERFISVRPRYNREIAVEAALKHSGREEEMREEIAKVARAMLDYYEVECKWVPPAARDKEKIACLSYCISILRSPVARDHQRNVTYAPDPEVGTRISKQFLRLGQALEVLGHYDYKVVVKCAWDCVSVSRQRLVKALAKHGEMTTEALQDATRLSKNIVLTEGDNLWLMHVLQLRESNTKYFRLASEFEAKMSKAEL